MSMLDQAMTSLGTLQAVAVARMVAADAMPYFAQGVLSLVPRELPGLGTLGVTKDSLLLVDGDVLRTWTPREAATVMLHEYLHIFFDHAQRFARLVLLGVLADTPEDRALWNQSADCEINDDLEAAGLPFPSDGTPCTPTTMQLKPNRTAEEYAMELKQQRKNQPPMPQQPQAGGGWCGSGAGNPVPNEPVNDPAGRSPVEQDVQRRADSQAVQQAGAKDQGSVPGGIARQAGMLNAPPKVRWQDRLARLTASAMSYRPGGADYTRSKPSRRQGAVGYMDQPIMPSMRQSIAQVAVVMDTSGSMGEAELSLVMRELKGVLAAQPGMSVTFMACDAAVHSMVEVHSVAQAMAAVAGGGGTDFNPAFEALAKAKRKPDLVVYATDGYGSAPLLPPKVPVVWLLVGGTTQKPAKWGECVEVKE